jgi:hypothetical protein
MEGDPLPKIRASPALLSILSSHVESYLLVESHFFNFTLTNFLFYPFFYYFILTFFFFFSLSSFLFSSSFLHQAANPTSKTQQQPPLHQVANSKPNIQNQPLQNQNQKSSKITKSKSKSVNRPPRRRDWQAQTEIGKPKLVSNRQPPRRDQDWRKPKPRPRPTPQLLQAKTHQLGLMKTGAQRKGKKKGRERKKS